MKQPPKTIDEAVDRLRAGERFHLNGAAIFYKAGLHDGPFRCGGTSLNGYWDDWVKWQPIKEWYEILSPENPRLCWINQRRDSACWITGYDKQVFYSSTGSGYRFATPVLPEHLDHD